MDNTKPSKELLEACSKLACKIQPDVLESPMPYPSRLDYTAKIIAEYVHGALTTAQAKITSLEAELAVAINTISVRTDELEGTQAEMKEARRLSDEIAVANTQAHGTIHRLERDGQTLKNALDLAIKQRDQATAANTALQERVDRMHKALRFYRTHEALTTEQQAIAEQALCATTNTNANTNASPAFGAKATEATPTPNNGGGLT